MLTQRSFVAMRIKHFLLICLVSLMAACRSARVANTQPASVGSIRFHDEYVIPHAFDFNGTRVGGLSGIDYDAARNQYYMICDDRSYYNPSRFYTADIRLNGYKIDTCIFKAVTLLRKPDGDTFAVKEADPEAMRFLRSKGLLVWSSEGEREVKKDKTVLTDPWVWLSRRDGKFVDSFRMPPNMRMQAKPAGPRQNGTFEGLGFADNERTLWVSLEEPLYEDGPRANINDTSAVVRFLKFDVATRQQVAQFAYRVDPVPNKPNPETAYRINGIPDILPIGNNRFLVMERAFSVGVRGTVIRIYLADANGATDVSSIASLSGRNDVQLIRKQLLFDMEKMGRYIDNVEGMTFGPKLPNGNVSLLLIADDNFDKQEESQIFLFEVLP
jgi:hypothetical protein